MTNPTSLHHNLSLATLGHRFFGFLLDAVVPFAGLLVFMPFGEDVAKAAGVVSLLAAIVVQFVLIAKRSQSIGKYLLNIYVVDIRNRRRCSFWRYILLREVIGKTWIIGAIPVVGIVVLFVDSLFIFRKDHRTVHDLIAGTAVYRLPIHYRRTKWLDSTALPCQLS